MKAEHCSRGRILSISMLLCIIVLASFAAVGVGCKHKETPSMRKERQAKERLSLLKTAVQGAKAKDFQWILGDLSNQPDHTAKTLARRLWGESKDGFCEKALALVRILDSLGGDSGRASGMAAWLLADVIGEVTDRFSNGSDDERCTALVALTFMATTKRHSYNIGPNARRGARNFLKSVTTSTNYQPKIRYAALYAYSKADAGLPIWQGLTLTAIRRLPVYDLDNKKLESLDTLCRNAARDMGAPNDTDPLGAAFDLMFGDTVPEDRKRNVRNRFDEMVGW